jgi:hypothetical protein
MKNLKQFAIYACKWQLGIIVAWPCTYLFKNILGWSDFSNIVAFQFIGACVFWNVDRWIFTKFSRKK